VLEKLNKRDNC